ncbi:MAG: rhomboid family intramembrane serine protease [Rhodothermaceae bacterium]|nr:rhomboid family intramembrane serine protease [Rhodothermaceae bacterium]
MYQQSGFQQLPTVIKNLLIINGLVFLAQMTPGPLSGLVEQFFALWPIGPGPDILRFPDGSTSMVHEFWPWQLVTYGFLHGGFMHIFLNMFMLWMLGAPIERLWGAKRFAIFYFVCVVGGGILQLGATYGGGAYTLGASGGVMGVAIAFGMVFAEEKLIILPIPFPIKGKWMAVGYFVINVMGAFGPGNGVAYMAHLGGMVFGYLLIQYWRGKLPIKPEQRMYY